MSDFKAKMHQIRFRFAGGAYSAPPDLLAGFKGPTSKGREGKGWRGWEGPTYKGREVKGRRGSKGRGGEGKGWKERGREMEGLLIRRGR